MSYPDFIGIGAMRSGTTWLTTQLRHHPEIWMPPIKELHYFDSFERSIGNGSLEKLSFSKTAHQRKKSVLRCLIGNSSDHGGEDLEWRRLLRDRASVLWHAGFHIRFLFGQRNDDWYEKCFAPGAGQIAGEIDPNYGPLHANTVAHIRDLMPDLRIIFMVRDPIERAWSHFLKKLRDTNRTLESVSEEECLAHFGSNFSLSRGSYSSILSTWSEYYPPEQICVGYYEEIIESPEDLLLRIFQFLNVEASSKHISDKIHDRYNSSTKSRQIPPHLERHLAETYRDEVEHMAAKVGGHAYKWLNRVEELLV
ncbi:MAG: sulfotransferase [Prochloraceae cyanobacterium]|nr:sulfotransferase [Prochloraceae cyanobacterium]